MLAEGPLCWLSTKAAHVTVLGSSATVNEVDVMLIAPKTVAHDTMNFLHCKVLNR